MAADGGGSDDALGFIERPEEAKILKEIGSDGHESERRLRELREEYDVLDKTLLAEEDSKNRWWTYQTLERRCFLAFRKALEMVRRLNRKFGDKEAARIVQTMGLEVWEGAKLDAVRLHECVLASLVGEGNVGPGTSEEAKLLRLSWLELLQRKAQSNETSQMSRARASVDEAVLVALRSNGGDWLSAAGSNDTDLEKEMLEFVEIWRGVCRWVAVEEKCGADVRLLLEVMEDGRWKSEGGVVCVGKINGKEKLRVEDHDKFLLVDDSSLSHADPTTSKSIYPLLPPIRFGISTFLQSPLWIPDETERLDLRPLPYSEPSSSENAPTHHQWRPEHLIAAVLAAPIRTPNGSTYSTFADYINTAADCEHLKHPLLLSPTVPLQVSSHKEPGQQLHLAVDQVLKAVAIRRTDRDGLDAKLQHPVSSTEAPIWLPLRTPSGAYVFIPTIAALAQRRATVFDDSDDESPQTILVAPCILPNLL